MKPTARNIAEYVNKQLDRDITVKGKPLYKSNNIAISLPKLNKNTLEALRNNYNFKVVRVEGFLGYVYFER